MDTRRWISLGAWIGLAFSARAESPLDRAKDLARETADQAKEHASEEAKLPEDPAALVKLLGDPAYAMREAAQKALEAQGEKAEAALKKGLASDDAEVRERCEKALEGIRVARRDAPLKMVTITLSTSKPAFRRGDPVTLTQTFTNTGKTPVLLLKCLDGSTTGRRGPFVSLEVKNAEGKEIPEPPQGKGG